MLQQSGSTAAPRREITLAFSGASGACYGWRLLQCLLSQHIKVHLLISQCCPGGVCH